jgi:AcrR family transcriptional regulator
MPQPVAKPRVRRSRDESRELILKAAEALLLAGGPAAVSVRAVAAKVSLTDAAVNHHFGTRAELLEALLRHCGRKLVMDLAAARGEPEDGARLDLQAVGRALNTAYVDHGAAQMAVWLRIAGWRPRGSGMLTPLVERMHAVRGASARGSKAKRVSDAQMLAALLNAVYIAQAVLGETLLRAVGAPADAAGQQRFLEWTCQLVAEQLA